MLTKKNDWFKLKRYPHIGLPLTLSDREWVIKYIEQHSASHSFLPFIHRTSKVRKFRKDYDEDDGKLKLKKRIASSKPRELYYASHLDSVIYSYFTSKLNDCYEEKISRLNISKEILAYRKIPLDPTGKRTNSNKCTIDFAKEVFDYIVNYEQDDFVVMTFDVSGFFDNLDHKLLLAEWCNIQGITKLDNAQFNVFKSLARFNYVELVDLFKVYQDNIITEKFNKRGKSLGRQKKRISAIKYLKNQSAIAFCEKGEFLKNNKSLIKRRKYQVDKLGVFKIDSIGRKVIRNYGIPQGTPISALLSNIYMIPFDVAVKSLIGADGLYRRYCDDIIIVCKKADYVNIHEQIFKFICERKLEIQTQKTQTFYFKREENKLKCGQKFLHDVNFNKKLAYLGFEFDGNKVLIKSASISSFYRKMKRGVRRGLYYSSKIYNGAEQPLFKKRLYKRYSHFGAKRTRIYLPDRLNQGKFYISERYNWGNFLSYAYKAEKVFKTGCIKKQVRNHWKIFHKLMN